MILLTRFLRLLVLALLVWTVTAYTTGAEPASPPWRRNLTCDPVAQKYRGIEYCTGPGGQVYVIVMDLNSPGVRLEYIIAHGVDGNCPLGRRCEPQECQDVNRSTKKLGGPGCDDPDNRYYYPLMPLGKAVEFAKGKDANTAAVINSDYGARSQGGPVFRDHGPQGFTVVRGKRLDGPANGDFDGLTPDPDRNNAVCCPWLAVSQNAPLHAELTQYKTGEDRGQAPGWVYTGVGGGPWLIKGGQVKNEGIAGCTDEKIGKCAPSYADSCRQDADQTAVGLSQDRRWLFLIVDVRRQGLLETAKFMKDQLDAWDAIKFDGGGSSQLWYGGLSQPFITRGDGRHLSQYLAVIAERGSGIEDSPKEKTGLWEQLIERIHQAIEQWFTGWQQRIAKELERLLEELETRLREFIEHELEQLVQRWIEETCGSKVMLLGGVLLVTLYQRRRSRR
jgi:hypothetical protein